MVVESDWLVLLRVATHGFHKIYAHLITSTEIILLGCNQPAEKKRRGDATSKLGGDEQRHIDGPDAGETRSML